MQKTQPYDEKTSFGHRLLLVSKDQPLASSLLSYADTRADLEVVHVLGLEKFQSEHNPVGRYDASWPGYECLSD